MMPADLGPARAKFEIAKKFLAKIVREDKQLSLEDNDLSRAEIMGAALVAALDSVFLVGNACILDVNSTRQDLYANVERLRTGNQTDRVKISNLEMRLSRLETDSRTLLTLSEDVRRLRQNLESIQATPDLQYAVKSLEKRVDLLRSDMAIISAMSVKQESMHKRLEFLEAPLLEDAKAWDEQRKKTRLAEANVAYQAAADAFRMAQERLEAARSSVTAATSNGEEGAIANPPAEEPATNGVVVTAAEPQEEVYKLCGSDAGTAKPETRLAVVAETAEEAEETEDTEDVEDTPKKPWDVKTKADTIEELVGAHPDWKPRQVAAVACCSLNYATMVMKRLEAEKAKQAARKGRR